MIVEFVSKKWCPFSDLTFHCSNNGIAYVEDFLYEEVKEWWSAPLRHA